MLQSPCSFDYSVRSFVVMNLRETTQLFANCEWSFSIGSTGVMVRSVVKKGSSSGLKVCAAPKSLSPVWSVCVGVWNDDSIIVFGEEAGYSYGRRC